MHEQTYRTGMTADLDRQDRRVRRAHAAAFAVLVALTVILPQFLYPIFLMKVFCFALLAMSFNLLLGYGGLLSFGHAAYFGLASYICAYVAKTYGIGPELSIIAGTLASTVLGLVFGAIAIRRQGIYFAMVTLALAQMVYFFSLQATALTGGEDGIQAVPRGRLLGIVDLMDERALYIFVAVVFLGGVAFVYRVIHSPFGQVLKAIRENEPRATSLGFRTAQYKLVAFVLSASVAGLAGATKAIVFQLATLNDVHWSMSGEAVLMTLVGGMGSIFGPIIGAAVIVALQNYLANLGAWVTIVQGAIFIVTVLLFRQGIIGLASRIFRVPL